MDQHCDPGDETNRWPWFTTGPNCFPGRIVMAEEPHITLAQRLAAIEQKLDALIREFGTHG